MKTVVCYEANATQEKVTCLLIGAHFDIFRPQPIDMFPELAQNITATIHRHRIIVICCISSFRAVSTAPLPGASRLISIRNIVSTIVCLRSGKKIGRAHV